MVHNPHYFKTELMLGVMQQNREHCWTTEELVNRLGMTKPVVYYTVNALIDKGLIDRNDKSKGKTNYYTLAGNASILDEIENKNITYVGIAASEALKGRDENEDHLNGELKIYYEMWSSLEIADKIKKKIVKLPLKMQVDKRYVPLRDLARLQVLCKA